MALKTFNPTSAGRRHLIQVDRSQLWKGKPVKGLVEGLSKNGGRGNSGRITTRGQGGGHKRAYRLAQSTTCRPWWNAWNMIRTAQLSSP